MRNPRLFTISPSNAFLPTLAKALAEGRVIAGLSLADPLHFASATLFLPNRRSCRLMREAFLALSPKAMLLPALVPLGDDDEEALFVAPADAAKPVDVLDRQVILAQMIRAFGKALRPDQLRLAQGEVPIIASGAMDALSLAKHLMALMDQAATERVSWDRLDNLVADHLDIYWQLTRDFLKIATLEWPNYLAGQGLADAAVLRDRALSEKAERLKNRQGPVIAAGSTGSITAARDVMKAIALHPQGAVVLPGFFPSMDEAEWQALHSTDVQSHGHPLYGLARLVRHIGSDPQGVVELAAPENLPREALLRIAMRSTQTTDQWHEDAKHIDDAAFDGLALIEAAQEQEEALALALVLRQIAQDPQATAALITPNRTLAQRVMGELERWHVAYDDSGGGPLGESEAGLIARLGVSLALEGVSADTVLALLTHPMLEGPEPEQRSKAVAALDVLALRGLKAGEDFASLIQGLKRPKRAMRKGDPRARIDNDAIEAAKRLLIWLDEALEPLRKVKPGASLAAFAEAHFNTLAQLAPKPKTHGLKELAGFLGRLKAVKADGFTLSPADYPACCDTLMHSEVVRRKGAEGAKIRILGLPEARFVMADHVLLGGLVEGGWPMQMSLDPWLNRAMRASFGIDPPERRIGLAAHDFVQAMGNARVTLSYPQKQGGVPTVPSRWLQRLQAVAGEMRWTALRAKGEDILALARALDAPQNPIPAQRPAPKPPLDLRPTHLSVTEIETLQRDPYALYARHILSLIPLEAYDQPVGAAERGILIHEALNAFIADVEEEGWPAQPLERLTLHGRAAFDPFWHHADVCGFWWPRFLKIAEWFVGYESGRRDMITKSHTEIGGALQWQTDQGRVFTLTARADRIDLLKNGQASILDYKTGTPPSDKQVRNGLSPQLPLEAAMLAAGGFKPLSALEVMGLTYLHLKGLEPAGIAHDIKPAKGESLFDVIATTLEGTKTLINAYENAQQPYLSWAMPEKMKQRGGDYDHLARLAEWSVEGEHE